MVALALAGIAVATMTNFNLAASPVAKGYTRSGTLTEAARLRSPYLPPKLEEEATDSGEEGIRVRLHGRQVRITVPFGPS